MNHLQFVIERSHNKYLSAGIEKAIESLSKKGIRPIRF